MSMSERVHLQMKQAERKAKLRKKKLNYVIKNIDSCYSCVYSSRMTIEDPLECKIMNPDRVFIVGDVDPFGYCDAYQAIEAAEKEEV